ncbi:MAG: matrixin family metalloprotease [Sandaracinaceae bacterium]
MLSVGVLGAPTDARAFRTLADVEGTTEQVTWELIPRVVVDVDTFPEQLAALAAVELDQAAGTWNRVACTGDLFAPVRDAHDAEIHVRFVPDWTAAGFVASAAASTDVVFESGPSGGRIVSAIVNLNGDLRWVADAERGDNDRSFRIVLTHELGHTLALAHPCEVDDPEIACGPEHAGRVMHPIYENGGGTRLAQDDIDGACFLYESRAVPIAECADSVDCFDGEVCRDATCVADPLYGAACTYRSDCTTSYCIEDSSSVAGGICTRSCETNEHCPSGATCVPLEGVEEQVCAPTRGQSGCAVGSHPTRVASPLSIAFAILMSLFLRRARARRVDA